MGFSGPNISSNFTPHSRRHPVYVIHHHTGVCVYVVAYFDSVKAAIVQPIIKISFPHLNARKRRNRLLDGKILPASYFFFLSLHSPFRSINSTKEGITRCDIKTHTVLSPICLLKFVNVLKVTMKYFFVEYFSIYYK